MVIKYNEMKGTEKRTFVSAQVENLHLHHRKTLDKKLEEIFSNQENTSSQFNKKRVINKHQSNCFQSYIIIIEWSSLNKQQDIRFLSALYMTDFGLVKFHSFFNKKMFFTKIYHQFIEHH
jgi:hypothetical protein